MNNNIIIVPDCHCRDFYKKVLSIKDTPIIFLGDYMDPYPNEGFSVEHGINNLKEIIDFAKNNNCVTLLAGNHCEHYIWSNIGCTRFNPQHYSELHKLYRDNIDLFKPVYLIDDVLFSHAGISKGWLESLVRFEQLPENYSLKEVVTKIEEDWKNELQYDSAEKSYYCPFLRKRIFDIGRIRGGDAGYGGPFWCDLREMENPFKDIMQIFGHSQLNTTGDIINITEVRHSDAAPAYCCDSREVFVFKNNKLTVYED